MPTYVFKCEGCGTKRPFLIHEPVPALSGKLDPVRKHCPTCRAVTNWVYATPEKRAGKDRRTGLDRRSSH
jgi:hypothetical protein